MALPNTLDKDSPAGGATPSVLDNNIRQIKEWLEDVLGLADDVAVAAAISSITAAGLQYMAFQDTAADPASAGRLQRNGAALKYNDGAAARELVTTAQSQTLTNKTLTSPALTTPSITTGALLTSLLLKAGAADFTLTWATLAAARALSIPDPGGTDVFVLRDMVQTLLNKTLVTPIIASMANATHNHQDAAGGGALDAAAIASGLLAVARGGTNIGSYTDGDLIIATGAATLAALNAGTRGQVPAIGAAGRPVYQLAPVPGYLSRLEFSAGVTASNFSGSIVADGITLLNASGHPVHLANVNTSPIDMTVSGVNGLDTGTEQADTWYYVWVIYNGTTAAGLASLSPTLGGLTLPGGYTFGRLVSAMYNNSLSDLVPMRQRDRRIVYAGDAADGPRIVFTAKAGVTSYTAESIAAFIPPTRVRRVFGTHGHSTHAGSATHSFFAVAPESAGLFADIWNGRDDGTTLTFNWQSARPWDIPWISGTDLYWRTSSTGAVYRLGVRGFEMDL